MLRPMLLGSLSPGELYALSCAFLWSVAVILFRRSGDSVPPVVLNLFKNSLGLVLLLLTMLLMGAPFWPADQPLSSHIVLLLSGFIGIAVADSLFFASLNRLGAGGSAIVDCSYSPLVVCCAWLYLHETVELKLLGAMVLVAGAILVGTWQPSAHSTPQQRRSTAIGVAMGIASMVFMAIGIVMAKPVLETSDTLWATTTRLAGAMPLLLVQGLSRRYFAATRAAFTPGRHWWVMLPGSFVGAYLALILWIMGFKYAQATTAGVLNQTSTLIVLALATIFLREALTWRKALAIGLGFGGAVLAII